MADEPICHTCMRVHERDTNAPIACPVCLKIVGCFWHNRSLAHIRACERRRAGLPPLPPLWGEDNDNAPVASQDGS
jgi:hypothetical protein